MSLTESITHRGRGTWGIAFDVALVTVARVWRDSHAQREFCETRYEIRCTGTGWQDDVRSFETEAARAAFLTTSFGTLELEPISNPEVSTVAPPLAILVGRKLVSVTFVLDYLQLAFDGPCLTLTHWPLLRSDTGALKKSDLGYRDALCALINQRLETTAEWLDVGIALTFDTGVVAEVPAEDHGSVEIALLQDGKGLLAVWQLGELPYV